MKGNKKSDAPQRNVLTVNVKRIGAQHELSETKIEKLEQRINEIYKENPVAAMHFLISLEHAMAEEPLTEKYKKKNIVQLELIKRNIDCAAERFTSKYLLTSSSNPFRIYKAPDDIDMRIYEEEEIQRHCDNLNKASIFLGEQIRSLESLQRGNRSGKSRNPAGRYLSSGLHGMFSALKQVWCGMECKNIMNEICRDLGLTGAGKSSSRAVEKRVNDCHKSGKLRLQRICNELKKKKR